MRHCLLLIGQLASVSANELASMNIEELFTHLLQEPTNIIEDPGMNFLLLVDALDECEYDGRNRLLDVIMSQFHKLPTWIKFLVTGRPENQMAKKLEHLNPLVLDARDKNNQKDIEVFFEDSLRDILPSCDVKENVHRFVNQAEGLMLYAHYFVQFVKENKETVKPEDLSDIFPRGIASVYDQYFGRLQLNLGVEDGPFCDFLASIAAARSPLPVTVASRILGFCRDTVDGNSGQIQKISGSISTLLPIRNECIDVFHKSIIDWFSIPELYGNHRFTVDVNRGNAILSSECMKIYQAIQNRHNVVAEKTTEENYALQHGTYHSAAYECVEISERQRNELFRLACSLELLYAKLQSKVCDVFSIIEELQCIKSVLNLPNVDSMELDDCINCLKRHPYVLVENPEMIFQFLVNEAETTAMSLEACAVMHQPPFEIPLRVEVVNRAQLKNPVTSKFRCKTYVNCCDVLKDGEHSLLVCGCKGGLIHMFSLETGRELWSYQSDDVEVWPEEERCSYCVFVPHHGAVIYGRFDSAVTFKGESMQLFPDNSHSFIDSSVSQDGKKLVTRQTHLTDALFVWELDTGNMLARLEQTTASITCCTISSCGNFVISGSFDQGVSLWDINKAPNYRCQHNSFDGEQPFIIDCLASLEGSSQHVIVNSSKKQSLTVCEINTSTCEASKTTLLHLGSTHKSLGVSSSGGLLYVCGDSQRISCDNVPFQVRIVPISSATKWEYLKEVDLERVLLRDCETVYMCQSLEKAESAVVTDRGVQAISFSVDGKHVYVLSMVGMSMYEASSGRFLRNNTNVCQANFFALSPNGEFILIQTKDGFEIYNCKLEYQWSLLDHPVAHHFFFKFIDDDRVLFLSKRGDIQVWNIAESKLFVEKLNSNNCLVECCDVFTLEKSVGDISPWHYRLLCCNRHGSLSLHDTFKSRTFTQKVPNDQIVKCCKFSPDGRSVVTGHIDGTLRIWEGSLFELKKILPPGDGMVKGCGFLVQDLGDVIVGVHESGAFKVRDVFLERVLGFMSFEGKLRGLVTSPLNAQVCVALEDKIVILNVHGPEID